MLGESKNMFFLNFLILFLQETRSFLTAHFSDNPIIMYSILGLQFFLFFANATFNNLTVPKISLLFLIFVPLYLFNNLSLHCVFIILNIINLRKLTLLQVVRYALVIHIFFFIISFVILRFGMVHDEVWKMPKGWAHTLGFANPNTTSHFLNNLILLLSFFMLLCKKPFLINLLLLIPAYFIYKITFGRTYFIGIICYYFFAVLFQIPFFYKHNYHFYKIVPLLLGATLIVGIRMYEANPLIDILFSRRLSMSKQVVDGFSHINYLLGSSFMPKDVTIDSSYLLLFCEAGIFSVFFFMLLYITFVKKITAIEVKKFFPFVFFMFVAGVSEITFPVFTASTAVFYKILYQTATKKQKRRYCYE